MEGRPKYFPFLRLMLTNGSHLMKTKNFDLLTFILYRLSWCKFIKDTVHSLSFIRRPENKWQSSGPLYQMRKGLTSNEKYNQIWNAIKWASYKFVYYKINISYYVFKILLHNKNMQVNWLRVCDNLRCSV
jgi:hypothetical protein